MSDFEVTTHAVEVEPHPNADLLECVRIGGYFTVVQKGQFQTGDIAAYIPEQSVLPDSLIQEMGLEGKLAGAAHNRVKAVRLRGVLSQGLVYPLPGHPPGTDVAQTLGIVKYEPPIPPHFRGDLKAAPGGSFKYDIEDIKKNPGRFTDGEEVIITEKIHGTWCCIGWRQGQPMVSSKGLADKGLAFDTGEGRNRGNIYVECFREHEEALRGTGEGLGKTDFLVLGEIYGAGVQDLKYGLTGRSFRAFDICVWDSATDPGRFLDYGEAQAALEGRVKTAPLLYQGPFSQEIMLNHTSGESTLGGNKREGVVVKPAKEREDPPGERAIAKSVSEAYLLRKGGTELQ